MADAFGQGAAGFAKGLVSGMPAAFKLKRLRKQAEALEARKKDVIFGKMLSSILDPKNLAKDRALVEAQIYALAEGAGIDTRSPAFKQAFKFYMNMADDTRIAMQQSVNELVFPEDANFSGTQMKAITRMMFTHPEKALDFVANAVKRHEDKKLEASKEGRAVTTAIEASEFHTSRMATAELGRAQTVQEIEESAADEARTRTEFAQRQADRDKKIAAQVEKDDLAQATVRVRGLAGAQAAGDTGTPTTESLRLSVGTLLAARDFEGATSVANLMGKFAPPTENLENYVDKQATNKADSIVLLTDSQVTEAHKKTPGRYIKPQTGMHIRVNKDGGVDISTGGAPTAGSALKQRKEKVKAAGDIAAVHTLLRKVDRFGQGASGIRRAAAIHIGGFISQFNEALGEAFSKSVANMSQAELEEIKVSTRVLISRSIKLLTGEASGRVSKAEQDMTARAQRGEALGASFSQVSQALESLLKLHIIHGEGIRVDNGEELLYKTNTDEEWNNTLKSIKRAYPGMSEGNVFDLVDSLTSQEAEFRKFGLVQ